jgi:transglutaminase-like putative cysteine protease
MNTGAAAHPMAPAGERVSFESLLWITGCLALTLLADVTTLPIWVLVTVVAAAAIRLVLAARGRSAPPRAIRLVVSVVAIGLLFLQLHTFNGLSAGTALLSLIAGLKLLETQTRRDIYVITMIIYFLSLSALLDGESFWLLSYLIAVCWLTTSSLLRLTSSRQSADWRVSVRYAGRILAHALPLAVAFWLFFPRFGGPLWQMPSDGKGATSGLSDTMSPGDITDLAMSDDVAFRVSFNGTAPPPKERYWRGPVLHDFDGHTWRRTESGPARAPTLAFDGPAYRYKVSLEPNQHNWLFVLDWPAQWDAPRGFLTSDFMLVQTSAVSQPLDVIATSYTHARASEPLSVAMRLRDTLPPEGNPRSVKLAHDLRAAHPGDADYVRAVLSMFHTQAFFYTLTPPPLGLDSVDGFLFDSKQGFCGHYASAFAVLMRAAGIPARVVTGYHGGTFNRFADYWILRQSDAHAWDEVWIEGQGWQRVDPTAVIAPERVERGLNDMVSADRPVASRWQQRTPWLADTRLRLDALRLMWRERILRFDQSSQDKLLSFMHVPEPDGQKLALVLAACLILGMMWLTWQVRRELKPAARDRVARAYAKLCARLAAAGVSRRPHEGAEAFASRVAAARPDLGAVVTALCRRYSELRYGATRDAAARHDAPADARDAAANARDAGPTRSAEQRSRDCRSTRDSAQRASDAAAFIAGVRAFRPRGSRGSS